MSAAYLVLLVANLVFSTGYAVTRVVLNDVGPATLGLARVLIGAVLLLGWAAWQSSASPRVPPRIPWTPGDRVRVALMGVVGFALAFAFGNWGLAHSTASNAALLITVEPTTLLVLAPLLLGERLSRRETVGAALTLLGAVVVVVNGVFGGLASAAGALLGGYVVVRRTPTDLTELVAAQARNLGLGGGHLTLPATAVVVDLDVGLTTRIIDNLLGNAAHHTPAGTAVCVEIAAGGDDLVLTVADRGPGVPDEAKESVFEAFERHGGRDTSGLGLGLFIVRRFAELQGGRAWVEDAPGGGAAFKVALRCGPDSAADT